MAAPKGTLTAAQYEILEALWDGPEEGMTVAAVWKAIEARRSVGRTTVLNLMDRLGRRGWLLRHSDASVHRYTAVLDRDATEQSLASGFLSDFFARRPVRAFTSLLGAGGYDPNELEHLREAIEQEIANKKRRKR